TQTSHSRCARVLQNQRRAYESNCRRLPLHLAGWASRECLRQALLSAALALLATVGMCCEIHLSTAVVMRESVGKRSQNRVASPLRGAVAPVAPKFFSGY